MLENSKGQGQQSGSGQQEETSADRGRQNASSNRGGTTDLSEDALTSERDTTQRRGADATTKNTVTGSDFDGQVSGQ